MATERVVTTPKRLNVYVSEVRHGKVRIGFWEYPPYPEFTLDVRTAEDLADKLSAVLFFDALERGR